MKSKKNMAAPRLFRKSEVDDKNNLHLPIPTQVVSNEEHLPIPQTDAQKRVECELTELADRTSKSLGVTRRQFLAASGGMAAAFLAMNSVFGKFFDVEASELIEPASADEKFPKKEFIFDIHTHHVAAGKVIPPLIGYRKFAEQWTADLRGREHKIEDLYLANYVKEVFLDSDTVMAVITGLPAPSEDLNVLPPAEMVETRAEINGLAKSKRMLAHGLIRPPDGKKDLELMQYQKEVLKVDAWKGYPGQAFRPGDKGWAMDDEKTAYPAYETARKLGVKNVCVHKGLALPGWDVERSNPKDIPKAALDFPDLNFLIYHAGFQGLREAEPAVRDDFKTNSYVPWISDLCEARRKNPKMTNVYMDLGTTFGMMVITHPKLCAHALGMMIQAFGDDHVLWGTDSIWWGSPQWQIEAFRRFQIPEDLQKRFGYKPLTPKVKAKIFGLNAAKIHGVDVKAKLNSIPTDYVSKLKAKYRAENYQPSNTQYGWIAGK
jgi:predicted TIM-barrel fold metal-dependent hydrolase